MIVPLKCSAINVTPDKPVVPILLDCGLGNFIYCSVYSFIQYYSVNLKESQPVLVIILKMSSHESALITSSCSKSLL